MADENGSYGLDRREGQPTQPLKPQQPDSVPLAPVMAPRPSSFSRVGENERLLADALGKADIGLDKYIQQKQNDWQLEGQMAYAEGKTEKEIVDQGNRYTTAGYMTMKARTAGNLWMENALSDIESGTDAQMSSADYQKKLSQQFSKVSTATAGTDPYTKNLLGSMASEMFPKLVAHQVKANNIYNEQQTFDNYTGMLLSEAGKTDPTDPTGEAKTKSLNELMQTGVGGLNEKRQREAITSAVSMGLETNNPALYKAYGVSAKEQLAGLDGTNGIPKGGLAYVLGRESTGERYGADGKLLQGPMTKYGTAKGEMQVLDSTTTSPGYGVTPAKDNSADERARVGRDYLSAMNARYQGDFTKALAAYHAGPENTDQAIAAAGPGGNWLAKLGPQTQAYVGGWGKVAGNPGAIENTTQQAATQQTLLKAGFNPTEVVKITKAFDEYQTRQTQNFDKQRTITEADIISTAKTQGNLPGTLDTIATKVPTYGPKWGEHMADQAKTAVAEYEKEHGKIVELQNANSNNTVAQLTGEKQEKAIDLKRTEISGTYSNNQSMNTEQKTAAIRNDMVDYLIKNQVVDDKWKRGLNAALTGNIINPDGTVRKEAMQAYADYQLMAKKANPTYAARYLNEAKDMVATAEAYDADGMSSEQAIRTASEVMSRKQNGADFTPMIDQNALKVAADAAIDKLDPSFWNFSKGPSIFSGNQAAGFGDIRDAEIEQAKASPVVSSLMHDYALRAKLRNPNLTDAAAVKYAQMELGPRMELVIGNPLVGGKQSTIRDDMGINDGSTNAVGKAMLTYLHDFGKDMWGDNYNKFQFLGDDPNANGIFSKFWSGLKGAPGAIEQSTEDKWRGVPDVMITYDTDRKGFNVDLYANKERTILKNTPRFISAQQLGQYWNAIKTPDNTSYQDMLSYIPKIK